MNRDRGPNSVMLGPCWHIFRSCALLGIVFRILLRLWRLLVVLFTFWRTSGTILEGPGTLGGRFWRLQGLIFRGFFAHMRRQCEKGPRGVSYWKNQYETHVGHPVRNAKNKPKTIQQPLEQSCPSGAPGNDVLERAGIDLGRVLAPPGCLLGGSWTVPGHSWALLGGCWAYLGRSFGALGSLLAAK